MKKIILVALIAMFSCNTTKKTVISGSEMKKMLEKDSTLYFIKMRR